MKLIIQIPCYNEEKALPITLSDLPRKIPGVDIVEWLIIDDGSTDLTAKIAKDNDVDHIVRLPRHQGLARAFMAGLKASLMAGADIVLNTDADNQYSSHDIPKLIKPILSKNAEIVVGTRSISEIEHFSFAKKILQKIGSWIIRLASNTDIPDAPSGFRAFSREAAQKINVFNDYTYTLETIIQAGQKNIPITWVPVDTNKPLRPSRLIGSIPSYIKKSIFTILRIFVVYKPFRFFMFSGLVLFIAGALIGIRFLYYYLMGLGSGHVQSLILASILIGIGFQTIMVAFIADLLSVNRRLLEDLQFKSRNDRKDDKP